MDPIPQPFSTGSPQTKLTKTHTLILGLFIGLVVGSGLTFLISSARSPSPQTQIHPAATQAVSAPAVIFRVIPESAAPGEEIVLRGGKFGKPGRVCFTDCSQEFQVLTWSSGSIRAQVSPQATGAGELWVTDGTGQESSKISFEVK